MRLLILGGTRFIGRALAAAALAEGHEVTLLHLRPSALFPEARHVLHDRETGPGPLAGEAFDAAIDLSAYVPRIAADAARTVRAARYIFLSSAAVYRPFVRAGADESAPLASPVRHTEAIGGETYGGLKVACEEEVRTIRPDAAVVRAGIVEGSFDPYNRLTYYVRRFRRGAPMLVPPRFEQPIQPLDVGDLAAFLLALAVGGASGVFNATGPSSTLGDLWQIGRAIEPTLEFVPLYDAERWGVKLGRDLPWALPSDGSGDVRWRVSCAKAISAGLRHRPLESTVTAVDDWLRREDPGTAEAWFGQLSAEREAAILREMDALPVN